MIFFLIYVCLISLKGPFDFCIGHWDDDFHGRLGGVLGVRRVENVRVLGRF
jgi:hypothetical protein